ncbi:MAG: hypothetical protein AAFR69_03975 [Pseudomonadota bacterium]
MGSLGAVLAGMIVAVAGVRFGRYLERRALAPKRRGTPPGRHSQEQANRGSARTYTSSAEPATVLDAKADPATGTYKTRQR